jgi:hypothetical protein
MATATMFINERSALLRQELQNAQNQFNKWTELSVNKMEEYQRHYKATVKQDEGLFRFLIILIFIRNH